jgi:hypothetical protein
VSGKNERKVRKRRTAKNPTLCHRVVQPLQFVLHLLHRSLLPSILHNMQQLLVVVPQLVVVLSKAGDDGTVGEGGGGGTAESGRVGDEEVEGALSWGGVSFCGAEGCEREKVRRDEERWTYRQLHWRR